jgi:hypothetical protein
MCSLVEVYGRFGGTYYLHFQDRGISQASSKQYDRYSKSRKQQAERPPLAGGFRLVLVSCLRLDTEDGVSTVHLNMGKSIPEYTASRPRI